MSWDVESINWRRVVVLSVIFSIVWGLASGFSRACTIDLLDNEPTYIYYSGTNQEWIDDVESGKVGNPCYGAGNGMIKCALTKEEG